MLFLYAAEELADSHGSGTSCCLSSGTKLRSHLADSIAGLQNNLLVEESCREFWL